LVLGAAARVYDAPEDIPLTEHVWPQVIPDGLLVTVPFDVFELVTVKEYVVELPSEPAA